jgi:hypothetical protein
MKEFFRGQERVLYGLFLLIDCRHRLAGRLLTKIDRFARLIIREGERRGCS